MDLDSRIHSLAESFGADYCGVADLTDVQDVIRSQGGELVTGPAGPVIPALLSWGYGCWTPSLTSCRRTKILRLPCYIGITVMMW